jgi:hypothetical protein
VVTPAIKKRAAKESLFCYNLHHQYIKTVAKEEVVKTKSALVMVILTVMLSAGAALAGGGKMFVVIDRGIDGSLNEGQVKNRNQTGECMEKDLVAILEKAGFGAEVIKDRSEFKGGEGEHLLVVKIKEYNPGSAAARWTVGFGAGAASMKTHYELFGSGPQPILSDDLGVGSGRDWRNVIRKLDEQTVAAVKKKLM